LDGADCPGWDVVEGFSDRNDGIWIKLAEKTRLSAEMGEMVGLPWDLALL
jgi:hypothetical protein